MKNKRSINKKPLLVIAFCALFLLIPIRAAACPHYDVYGYMYYQRFNRDSTIMLMTYPFLEGKNAYMYTREVLLDNIEYSEEIAGFYLAYGEYLTVAEMFGFPIVQDDGNFFDRYGVVHWEPYYAGELIQTIKDIDSLFVTGQNYNLDVKLGNTYREMSVFADDKVAELFYEILVKRLNDSEDDERFIAADTILKENNVERVVPEMLKIDTRMSSCDLDYLETVTPLSVLHDPVEVQIYSDTKAEDVVAINMDNLREMKKLDVTYDDQQKVYKFVIDEAGTYVLVKNGFEIDLPPEETQPADVGSADAGEDTAGESGEGEDKSGGFNPLFVILPGSAIVIAAPVAIIAGKKKKK